MSITINSAIQYECKPDWEFNRFWEDYTFWYVTAGSCVITQGDDDFHCNPDSCYIFRPGFSYQGRYLNEHKLTVWVIHFDCDSDELPVTTHYDYQAANPLLIRDQLERLLRQSSRGADQAAVEWLRTILRTLAEDAEFMQSESNSLSELDCAIDRISQDVSENPEYPFRIDDLAKDACVSTGHFRRLFKERIGMSPKSWIIQCRIRHAKGLLLSTSYSIEQIAELCGFHNVFFFSRQFKEKTGVAPSQYRG